MTSDLTPRQAARGALRAGLALDGDRHAGVAATANHIHSVITTLREPDFGDTPPRSPTWPDRGTPMQPFELSLTDAARAVRARELSPVELTASVLERIGAVEGRLRAYVTVTADIALAAATSAGREISTHGPRGPLHGIPVGLKDLIDAEGLPTTASSEVRAGHVAERDSHVAARLKAAGAVLLGKTHTHEFA